MARKEKVLKTMKEEQEPLVVSLKEVGILPLPSYIIPPPLLSLPSASPPVLSPVLPAFSVSTAGGCPRPTKDDSRTFKNLDPL
jgi:hypothetical protein